MPNTEFNSAFVEAWKSAGYNIDGITSSGQASWLDGKTKGIQVQRAGSLFSSSNKIGRRQILAELLDVNSCHAVDSQAGLIQEQSSNIRQN